jgi:7,8-dihydropterin-6-yl-methyl-4-(beta-D-ribofuranosyl)aminobenzene 5'-phosphate synthase
MKITTLIENTKDKHAGGVGSEHGVSLFVELDALNLLFDTGASSLFLRNAARLNLNIGDIDLAVVSHGHYDHGGGLETFLKENERAPVYIHGEAFGNIYKRTAGSHYKYVGLDKTLKEKHRNRFVFVSGFTEVRDNVFILTDMLQNHPRHRSNRTLMVERQGTNVPDDFAHEIMLVIREHNGLVVFTGCSHSGILNMIETVENRFEGEFIKAVIGGFHLMNISEKKLEERVEDVAKIARQLNGRPRLQRVFTGHCTGSEAYDILKSLMHEKLAHFAAGSVITL